MQPKPRVYTLTTCDTCRKAVRFLRDRGIDFTEIPIRQHPPTNDELRHMLALTGGELRRLFNTSGQDYKAMGMKDRLPGLSENEAIALLAANGNLVKRPFLLTETGGAVGFREEEWARIFS